MAATRSKDFVLKRYDGVSAWDTIGGLRATSLTINNEQIDVTSKDGDDWRKMITGGIQSMSVSGGGVFENGSVMQSFLTDAMANTLNDYRLVDGNGNTFEGEFQITSYGLSGDHTAALEYTCSLESTDTVTLTLV